MIEANIVGDSETIREILDHFHATIVESFPSNHGERDINIHVEDGQVDDLIDWCDEHDLECDVL